MNHPTGHRPSGRVPFSIGFTMKNEIKRYAALWDDPIVQGDERIDHSFRSYGTPKPKILAIVEHEDGSLQCAQHLADCSYEVLRGFLPDRAIAVEEGQMLVDGKRLLAEQYLKLWADVLATSGPSIRSLAATGLGIEVEITIAESGLALSGNIDPTLGDALARLFRKPHPSLPGFLLFTGWLHRTETVWAWSQWKERFYTFKTLPEVAALWQPADLYQLHPRVQLQVRPVPALDLRHLDIFSPAEDEDPPEAANETTCAFAPSSSATAAHQMSFLL